MNKTNGFILIVLAVLAALVLYLAFRPKPSMAPADNVASNANNVAAKGFTINRPADFTSEESNEGGFYGELNLYTVTINTTDEYQKDTDLNLARVSVSVSPKTNMCYSSSGSADMDMTATKDINGNTFHYNPNQPVGDAAMGGQRGTVSLFALIVNNQCYRVQKDIGYRDLRGFSDGPYLPHFDEAKVNADLDTIISTLTIQ